MSLITLLPLALTLILALGFTYYALTRKSLAQSLCVREATQMQSELGHLLAKLIRLNPRAEHLRLEREHADLNLQSALASGLLPAIAIAQAHQLAVITAQMALRAEQQGLLVEATTARLRHQRELASRVRAVAGERFIARGYYYRALAVREQPPFSLTPNYVTVKPFEQLQQQRFSYEVPFRFVGGIADFRQITECAVTLRREDKKWNAKILAASASSKPR